jgi:hypothetical protein
MYKAFVPVAQQLAAMRAEADRVYSDHTIPGNVKRQILDQKWLEMVQVAQQFHRDIHPGAEPHPILGEQSEDTLQGVRRLLSGMGMADPPIPQRSRVQEMLELPGIYPYDPEGNR